MTCKVHICGELVEGPYGGSHQFLKALRNGLRIKGVYSEVPNEADILIFDSYQFIPKVIGLKSIKPELMVAHRIDGPIRLYNSFRDVRDIIIYNANRFLADATIFQSDWSRVHNYRLGLLPTNYEKIIPNAPDPEIFNAEGKKPFAENGKVRLVAVSWSSNWKKGFKTYRWLDENLDFSKYEMLFIGNSPINFHNIKLISPLPSVELAAQLRNHDISIFASEFEACSNILLEALHCGLPVVAKNATSNPDVLNGGGELFDQPEEIPDLLERIVADYAGYRQRIQVLALDEVVDRYYSFLSDIWDAKKAGRYKPRAFEPLSHVRLLAILKWWRIRDRINRGFNSAL